jgi:hypothetical protein
VITDRVDLIYGSVMIQNEMYLVMNVVEMLEIFVDEQMMVVEQS